MLDLEQPQPQELAVLLPVGVEHFTAARRIAPRAVDQGPPKQPAALVRTECPCPAAAAAGLAKVPQALTEQAVEARLLGLLELGQELAFLQPPMPQARQAQDFSTTDWADRAAAPTPRQAQPTKAATADSTAAVAAEDQAALTEQAATTPAATERKASSS